MIQLLTLIWLFNTSKPPQGALSPRVPQSDFLAPGSSTNGFTLKFNVDLKTFAGSRDILEIPKVLNVRLRQADPSDRNRQNYPAFKMADGSVPVIEATLTLHSTEHPDWKNLTIGVPLGLLRQPTGKHEIVLNFTGVRWTLFVDGELLDNEFPFGFPQWADKNTWRIDTDYVGQAAIYLPAIQPEARQVRAPKPAPGIQYWTPPGHNSWVGDVVTLFHKGRYHVFYLYDRRHHASKFGCGAHYFEHLSTTDFKTWTEHEAAAPLDEQWECIGTGTPFARNKQVFLTYGLHTTRVYPQEKTSLPSEWDYLKQNGRTGKFERDATPGTPAGSTYAVSTDGVSPFRKSQILFHPCENPSVFNAPGGKLRMMANYHAKGIWESDSLDGGWRCVSPDFPPGGDCTFWFRWGRFDYIIGGFTRLWSKSSKAPDTAYEDVVQKGLDFYDGTAVPAISRISGGRYLMAGWIPVRGWGGSLVIRELLQFPDGRIGSKWMKELTPKTGKPLALATKLSGTTDVRAGSSSFLLVCTVEPGAGKKGSLGIELMPENGETAACELRLSLDEGRAQFGHGSTNHLAAREKSLREGGSANAIENLIGTDRPFQLRVVVRETEKLGGSMVDAEIAGARTLISYRADLAVKKIQFRTEGLTVRNVQIAPLSDN